MLTPSEEVRILNSLPERFERHEIYAMVDALQKDIAQETTPLAPERRVHRYAYKHRILLVSMPFLFRSICRGTFTRDMVDMALSMRDHMDNGMSKELAFNTFVQNVVDKVNEHK